MLLGAPGIATSDNKNATKGARRGRTGRTGRSGVAHGRSSGSVDSIAQVDSVAKNQQTPLMSLG